MLIRQNLFFSVHYCKMFPLFFFFFWWKEGGRGKAMWGSLEGNGNRVRTLSPSEISNNDRKSVINDWFINNN